MLQDTIISLRNPAPIVSVSISLAIRLFTQILVSTSLLTTKQEQKPPQYIPYLSVPICRKYLIILASLANTPKYDHGIQDSV